MIEILPIGGYDEVGKNCTAVNVDGEIVIFDLGLHLESYIKYTESEEEDLIKISAASLIKAGAIPNIHPLEKVKQDVKAIIPTHAHLDHIGAIPYLANKFECPIFCTPFTHAVLKAILQDEGITLKNDFKILATNAQYKLSDKITIEFINMTHSTPHTVMIALHTPYGVIIYANDFKLDNHPIIGKRPNTERLQELGKGKVLALICDSLYSNNAVKTPSESVAREMVKDVLLGTDAKDKLIIITTFASHLARLKGIIEAGSKLNRKIVFLGRSLAKYTYAGEEVGLVKFSDKVEIIKYGKHVKKRLSALKDHQRKNYVLVVTGHQGERDSVLSKMVDNRYPFKIGQEDHVIFSCKTIPCPTNIEHRKVLEKKLKDLGVRMFKDIHVSGHAGREDLRDLLHMVKPLHVIPAHGDSPIRKGMSDLALEMGFEPKKVHMVKNGSKISL